MPADPLHGVPSLDVIADQVAIERAALDHHADSLDTKAGVILGFSGVLVGLGATAQGHVVSGWFFRSGLIGAALAGVLAVLAFTPRPYPTLTLLQLRRRYITAPKQVTRHVLMDTQIEIVNEARKVLGRKARRLKASLAVLAASAALVTTGTLVRT